RGSGARCSSAGTPMRCPAPPSTRRSRCWPRTTSPRRSMRWTATRPRPPSPTRSWSTTGAARPVIPGGPTASWSRPATTRPVTAAGPRGGRRDGRQKALQDAGRYDYLHTYVQDLTDVVDLEAIRRAGVRIGADPLGGAAVDYWAEIGEMHDLDLTVVNPEVDPRWSFMTLDRDGRIRMDCSSPWAMASLLETPAG